MLSTSIEKIICLSMVSICIGVASSSYVYATETDNAIMVTSSQDTPRATTMAGADRDPHGCIGSAGYNWSESNGKCIRLWEEAGNTKKRLPEKLRQQVTEKVGALHLEKLTKVISNVGRAIKNIQESNASQEKKNALLTQLYEIESIIQDRIDTITTMQ